MRPPRPKALPPEEQARIQTIVAAYWHSMHLMDHLVRKWALQVIAIYQHHDRKHQAPFANRDDMREVVWHYQQHTAIWSSTRRVPENPNPHQAYLVECVRDMFKALRQEVVSLPDEKLSAYSKWNLDHMLRCVPRLAEGALKVLRPGQMTVNADMRLMAVREYIDLERRLSTPIQASVTEETESRSA